MQRKYLMIVMSLALVAGLLGVLPAPRALAATTYTWNQIGSASWAVAANWTPTRTTPATDDILVIDGSVTSSPTLTSVPTQTIAQLKLISNANATFTASAAATLTIAGATGADFDIGAGSSLTLSGATAIQISLSAGATGSVSGSMTVAGGAHRLIALDASGITMNSGAAFTAGTGFTGNAFGTTNLGSIVFSSGSTYVSGAGSNPFGASAPSSVVIFQAGSLYSHRQTGAPSLANRTYANFEVDGSVTVNITTAFGNPWTVDKLEVKSGSQLNWTHTSGTGSGALNIKGDLIVNGQLSFANNSSVAYTLYFNGSSAQTVSGSGTITLPASLSGVQVNNTNGVTLARVLQIGCPLTVQAGSTLATSATLTANGATTINGAFQLNSGGWATGSGVWTYSSGALLVFNSASSYGVNSGDVYWPTTNGPQNVTVLTGGLTMNAGANRTVGGTFQTAAGVTNGNQLTLNGTTQINTGGYFLTNAPTYGPASTLVYNPGGSYNIGAEWKTGSVVGSGVPKNVTLQNITAVTLPDGAGVRTVNGNLTINGGSLLTLGGSIGDDLEVGGNWVNNGAFNANSRAVAFIGTTTVSGSSTTTFAYVTISGALTGHSASMNVTNDWINNGTFNHNNGAVHFGGASEQTIGGASISSFFDIFLETFGRAPHASGPTVFLATQPTVEGTVTNNGTLKQTKTVNNAVVDFIHLKNAAGTLDKYFGVEIATANDLGSTTVAVSGNQVCALALGYPVKRCFDVTPTTPASADIKFYYREADMQTGQTYDTLNVWNYHSATWNAVTRGGDSGACDPGAINCYVQGNGIDTYSPFALKVTSPTAITLADFSAAQAGDAVVLTWETATELNNRGFNLYRGLAPGAPDRQLNETLIPSQSQGNPGGFTYTWEDRADLVPGTTYYYWVEDVDLNNVATRHGPVSVEYNAPTAVRLLDAGVAAPRPLTLPLAGVGLLALAGARVWRKRR